MEVDHRDIRKLHDEIVLEPRARGGVVRAFQRRDVGLRRLVESARPEHEHETATARIPPIDLANARDFRIDRAAQNVEPDRVPHVDRESLVDAPLHRHFGIGGRPMPELTIDELLIRLEPVAVRDGVLAREGSPRANVLEAFEVRLASADARDSRP